MGPKYSHNRKSLLSAFRLLPEASDAFVNALPISKIDINQTDTDAPSRFRSSVHSARECCTNTTSAGRAFSAALSKSTSSPPCHGKLPTQ